MCNTETSSENQFNSLSFNYIYILCYTFEVVYILFHFFLEGSNDLFYYLIYMYIHISIYLMGRDVEKQYYFLTFSFSQIVDSIIHVSLIFYCIITILYDKSDNKEGYPLKDD